MKYLILALMLSSSLPAIAMQPSREAAEMRAERPIKTFRRIKKEIRRDRQTWFTVAGLAIWAALFAWFAATLGLGFVLLFGGGCLGLILIGFLLKGKSSYA